MVSQTVYLRPSEKSSVLEDLNVDSLAHGPAAAATLQEVQALLTVEPPGYRASAVIERQDGTRSSYVLEHSRRR